MRVVLFYVFHCYQDCKRNYGDRPYAEFTEHDERGERHLGSYLVRRGAQSVAFSEPGFAYESVNPPPSRHFYSFTHQDR